MTSPFRQGDEAAIERDRLDKLAADDGDFIGGKIVSLRAYTAEEAKSEVEKDRGVKVIAVAAGTPSLPWRRT